MSEADELWHFWFGTLGPADWFGGDPAIDTALGARFAHLPDQALAGALDHWTETPTGTVALVLAVDQVPRHLWRGEARAFLGDAKARVVASVAIAKGIDEVLGRDERLFLYLPFEHSEDLADQDRACTLIGALGEPLYTDYAERHRAVIRRFGRFPHRNAALGRVSTPEEEAFLAETQTGF
jgi:uncharacterized protein (DUF924 family)